jgi:sec-independent protein translocase protein TatA
LTGIARGHYNHLCGILIGWLTAEVGLGKDLHMDTTTLGMFGLPGGAEWIVIGLIALLIFGRRLPDVARSVGKSIVEFKKGIRDVKDDVETQSRLPNDRESRLPGRIEQSASDSPTPVRQDQDVKEPVSRD